MELITNILIEYLKHNKRIVVPKLGAFIVKQPSGIIRFTDLMRNDDGILRSLLIAYGMSEIEATGKIDRFVFEIRHAISQQGKFTISGFGTFRASENNTIAFSHHSEPLVIGGNVKPPIEVLNAEKLKLQRLTEAKNTPAQPEKQKKEKKKRAQVEETPLSHSKPDSYLRGLNYDDRKKKHDEERMDKRRKPRRWIPLLPLLILVLVACSIYSLWYWLNSKSAEPQPIMQSVATESLIEADSLYMRDSVMVTPSADTLQQVELIKIGRNITGTNNL